MTQHLVLVGGGHSHVHVIKAFGLKPPPDVRVSVISRDRFTPYSGMLPGLIAGHYKFEDAHIHLARLADFAGADLIEDEVNGIDPRAKRVFYGDGNSVDYDFVSINIGSTPGMTAIEGASEHAIPVKPIGQFLDKWKRLRESIVESDGRLRIGIVGGGAGGVELVLAMQYRLGQLVAAHSLAGVPKFKLITAAPELLEGQARSAARRFMRILKERWISIEPSFHVTRVDADGVGDAAGRRISLDRVLWVTDAAPAAWISESGLATDGQGFLSVTDTLQSASHESVLAAGDIASMRNYPRPKSGVFAVRQGPPLTNNLRAALAGKPLRAYRPQTNVLSLIGTGDRYAVASRGRWSTEGRWVWRWKEWIDRRFMHRFNDLPA